MAVYTHLKVEYIQKISNLCNISFDPHSLHHIESGSTDSCYSLVDTDNKKYFLKIHENQETSPHALNIDQRYMVEFAHYLSTFNPTYQTLQILSPYKWNSGKVYGFVSEEDIEYGSGIPSGTKKVVSLWPYVTPRHPVPVSRKTSFDLKMVTNFAKATADLHNVSSNYSPQKVYPFPKDILDTEAIMNKIDRMPDALRKVGEYLGSYDNPFSKKPETFLQIMRERVYQYADEWRQTNLADKLVKGYIHGELKPSNTLIGRNGEIIFIDICKSGVGPLSLELGMAAQNFTNTNGVDLKGIETFIEAYLHARNSFPIDELKYIPFMIKVSAIRLAVYRTYAVSSGFYKQKFIDVPLQICIDLDEKEDELLSAILS